MISYTRPRNDQEYDEPDTHQLCPLCEASVPDEAYLTRQEMLRVRALADHRILKSPLYRGQRILGYRESMGGDDRWHGQIAGGSWYSLSESPLSHERLPSRYDANLHRDCSGGLAQQV